MKQTPLVLTSLLAVTIMGLAGCSSDRSRIVIHEEASAPAGVARLGHVVLIGLKDPADTDELLASSRASLAGIPGLTHYSAGTHLETGRDAVDGDYHVALYIGFDTEDDYAAYLVHPDHVAYVDAWRPRFTSIRIFDVLED